MRKGPSCHCQGGRLLVLLGPIRKQTTGHGGLKKDAAGNFLVEDPTMYTAQHWALEFYKAQRAKNAHIHMLGYDAPSGHLNDAKNPQIPKHAAAPAENINIDGKGTAFAGTEWSWKTDAHYDSLDKVLPSCCCFFTEVMLVGHGNQAGAYTFIIDKLRKILAGRPVEKLVIWACESSDKFTPAQTTNDYYQKIAWMMRPQMCPCGCSCDTCNAFDPDCKARHCPDGKAPTTILTSGEANGKPVKLGIDPSKANPLTSPDGRLREITIQPDGTAGDQVTAKMGGAGQQFFDDLSTGTDATLAPALGAANPQAVKDYADKNLKGSGTKAIPGAEPKYAGPSTDTSQCDAAEGCMTGAGCNEPS